MRSAVQRTLKQGRILSAFAPSGGGGWRDEAACAGRYEVPPPQFCRTCPAQKACALEALNRYATDPMSVMLVWGGIDFGIATKRGRGDTVLPIPLEDVPRLIAWAKGEKEDG